MLPSLGICRIIEGKVFDSLPGLRCSVGIERFSIPWLWNEENFKREGRVGTCKWDQIPGKFRQEKLSVFWDLSYTSYLRSKTCFLHICQTTYPGPPALFRSCLFNIHLPHLVFLNLSHLRTLLNSTNATSVRAHSFPSSFCLTQYLTVYISPYFTQANSFSLTIFSSSLSLLADSSSHTLV